MGEERQAVKTDLSVAGCTSVDEACGSAFLPRTTGRLPFSVATSCAVVFLQLTAVTWPWPGSGRRSALSLQAQLLQPHLVSAMHSTGHENRPRPRQAPYWVSSVTTWVPESAAAAARHDRRRCQCRGRPRPASQSGRIPAPSSESTPNVRQVNMVPSRNSVTGRSTSPTSLEFGYHGGHSGARISQAQTWSREAGIVSSLTTWTGRGSGENARAT